MFIRKIQESMTQPQASIDDWLTDWLEHVQYEIRTGLGLTKIDGMPRERLKRAVSYPSQAEGKKTRFSYQTFTSRPGLANWQPLAVWLVGWLTGYASDLLFLPKCLPACQCQ